MNETKENGRSILIAIGIMMLLFFNVGVFYTSRISHETDQATSATVEASKTASLNLTGLDQLQNRTHIDVESKLTPFQTGRANPFTAP